MPKKLSRRSFLKTSAASIALASASRSGLASAQDYPEGIEGRDMPTAKADACILLWLPGGVSQMETWDPKPHTPFTPGMKGSELLNTCHSIPSVVDDLFLGEGFENIASVMDRGCVVRSLSDEDPGSPSHPKYIYQVHTGYKFPAGFDAPSVGSIISRTLGRKHPAVPAYVDIGRLTENPTPDQQFLNNTIGPGFLGHEYGPLVVAKPIEGMKTLKTYGKMSMSHLDRRLEYQRKLAKASGSQLSESKEIGRYLASIEAARQMMDSPAREAFDFLDVESQATLDGYDLTGGQEKLENRFAGGCLLARRLVERGARFVEVEFPFMAFGLFDTHDNGSTRMVKMKQRVDKPIAQLIRDLEERGLLDTTLVCVMSEFGRTLAGQKTDGTFTRSPFSGLDTPEGRGETIILEDETMYGFHGHLRTWSCAFFGAGIRRGTIFGKTADRHPMMAVEDPVNVSDWLATIYRIMGMTSDIYYMDRARPVYVTNLGEGRPIEGILA